MKLLGSFAALALVVAALSALERDWLHTGCGVAGCLIALYITLRLRMIQRETDSADA